MRDLFEAFELSEYLIREIDNSASVVADAPGIVTVNRDQSTFESRWVFQNEQAVQPFGT